MNTDEVMQIQLKNFLQTPELSTTHFLRKKWKTSGKNIWKTEEDVLVNFKEQCQIIHGKSAKNASLSFAPKRVLELVVESC